MTHGYTFGYRRRLKASKNTDGQLTITIPQPLLDLMGVQEGEEVCWVLGEDGSAMLRKLNNM